MLPLFRNIGRAIKRRPLPGCLTDLSLSIRLYAAGIPNACQGSHTAEIGIGDDIWFAAGVKSFDGIVIGQGEIVGANAVVNRTTPAFAVAAGIPARVIKMRPGFDE